MRVYTNSPINISIEEENIEEVYETFIYSKNGIYKKYKKHFFQCDCENDIPKTSIIKESNREYYIQENSFKINKQKTIN